jgi:translation initiation factor 1A
MPKKSKKSKNSKNKKGSFTEKRVLVFKENMQEYAKIIKMLGDRKVTLVLPDSSQCMGIIPGKFRKRLWMKCEDVVLIGRREFQDNKLDIIYKYNDDEARRLVKLFEIPDFFLQGVTTSSGVSEEEGIIFATEDDKCAFDIDDI